MGCLYFHCHYWWGKEGRATRYTLSSYDMGVAETASGSLHIYMMPGCVWVQPTNTHPCELFFLALTHSLSYTQIRNILYIYIYICFPLLWFLLMTGKDMHRSKSRCRCPHVWQNCTVTGIFWGLWVCVRVTTIYVSYCAFYSKLKLQTQLIFYCALGVCENAQLKS